MTLIELIKSCPELGEWMADITNDIAYLINSMPIYEGDGRTHHPAVYNAPIKPIINVTYKTTEGKTPGFKQLKEELDALKNKRDRGELPFS